MHITNLDRVHNVLGELNRRRVIPTEYHGVIKERLWIAFKLSTSRLPPSKTPLQKRQHDLRYERKVAQSLYLTVLGEHPLLFIPFIIAIPVSSCRRFDMRKFRDRFKTGFKIDLEKQEQQTLDDIAAQQGFSQDKRYLQLVCTLFGSHQMQNFQESTPTITETLEILQDKMVMESDNAYLMATLLSFFAEHENSLDLLCRGGSPRKRWTEAGSIMETNAVDSGLCHELSCICSTNNLKIALGELCSISVISWISDDSFSLNDTTRHEIRSNLPPSLESFWSLQAFIIAYRSVPWKYLEFV